MPAFVSLIPEALLQLNYSLRECDIDRAIDRAIDRDTVREECEGKSHQKKNGGRPWAPHALKVL